MLNWEQVLGFREMISMFRLLGKNETADRWELELKMREDGRWDDRLSQKENFLAQGFTYYAKEAEHYGSERATTAPRKGTGRGSKRDAAQG